MTSCYVNMKLKIIQDHGKIVTLTSFPIHLSHSKEVRLPLLKLMSCIAKFLTFTKIIYVRVIHIFSGSYNWNWSSIWFNIPWVQISIKYNCNYLFHVHLYGRLSGLWLRYEWWQQIENHSMHSPSPPTLLGWGQNHRTQRKVVIDDYFFINC